MEKKTVLSLQLVAYQTALCLLGLGPYISGVADTQDSTLVVL